MRILYPRWGYYTLNEETVPSMRRVFEDTVSSSRIRHPHSRENWYFHSKNELCPLMAVLVITEHTAYVVSSLNICQCWFVSTFSRLHGRTQRPNALLNLTVRQAVKICGWRQREGMNLGIVRPNFIHVCCIMVYSDSVSSATKQWTAASRTHYLQEEYHLLPCECDLLYWILRHSEMNFYIRVAEKSWSLQRIFQTTVTRENYVLKRGRGTDAIIEP